MITSGIVLAGGMSLGAYQAGALHELLGEGGVSPAFVSGTSIGAFHAALIAGNHPGDRAARVRAFWEKVSTGPIRSARSDAFGTEAFPGFGPMRSYSNVLGVRALGTRGLFEPFMSGLGSATTPAFYDAAQARTTLTDLIDFELLQAGLLRCAITATDIVTGELVTFDTGAGEAIDLDMVMASSALLPSFPAVEVAGRMLGDGGFAANLPLWPLLDDGQPIPPVTIAIDLFSPDVPPPRHMAQAIARGMDLQFVAQTRLAIDRLVRDWSLRNRPGATLVHLVCQPSSEDAEPEKMFDFSAETIERRMAAGMADARRALARLADPRTPPDGVLEVVRISG